MTYAGQTYGGSPYGSTSDGRPEPVASGTLDIAGVADKTILINGLLVLGGTTRTIPTGGRIEAEQANISGELNIAGTLNLDGVTTEAAAGIADAEGTANATPDRLLIASDGLETDGAAATLRVADGVAAGELSIDGDSDALLVRPIIRGDSFGIDYDDDESVTLNAEQD